jgi:hypothetical protein
VRDVGDVPAHDGDESGGVGVRVGVHGAQHRDPGAGHPQGGVAEHLLEVQDRHGPTLVGFLETVKKSRMAAA